MFNEARRAAWMEISLGNIKSNYMAIRNLAPGCAVIACVKGNAYGHGIEKTAWEFVREGIEYLGVATIEEAVTLRSAGIFSKIVLLSPVPCSNPKDVIDFSLIPVITTFRDAELLSQEVDRNGSKNVPFFLALETGMGRLGFIPTTESFQEIMAITSLPGLSLIGVYSHFATADSSDISFAEHQLEVFNIYESHLREAGVDTGLKSMANSAAIISLPESHLDIIRPGIALYGIYPSEAIDKSIIHLEPAMTIKTHLVYIKKVPVGTPISYGSRFVTERESLIATMPIGYADGLPRNNKGQARILVRGQYAPIVGTVCMDLCMADVTDIQGVADYDEVVILGEQDGKTITAEEIAAYSDTNTYEVLCRFGQRLPRKYI